MMEMKWYLVVLVESLVLAIVLTPLAMRIAPLVGLVDKPDARRVHRKPTPLLGGAAIFAAFMLTVLGNIVLVRLAAPYAQAEGTLFQKWIAQATVHLPGIARRKYELTGLLLGGTFIFAVGLYDDRFAIRPKVKLAGQIVAALIFVAFFYIAKEQTSFFFIHNPILVSLLLIFWIVAITNSINLMDNMDGLCAGVSAISLFFFALVAYQVGEQTFMILAMLALLGAVLGFLWHNFNPARIFMGDAGSMFIGYLLACLIVFSTFYTAQSNTVLSLAMPPLVLAVPIFDTASVIAIRIRRGLPIYQGDLNHFSHRLVALGLSHKNAVLLIYLVTLCTGTGALLLHEVGNFGGVVILIQAMVILGIIWLLETVGRARGTQENGKKGEINKS